MWLRKTKAKIVKDEIHWLVGFFTVYIAFTLCLGQLKVLSKILWIVNDLMGQILVLPFF